MWSALACLSNNGAVAYATAIHITALIGVIPAEAGIQTKKPLSFPKVLVGNPDEKIKNSQQRSLKSKISNINIAEYSFLW